MSTDRWMPGLTKTTEQQLKNIIFGLTLWEITFEKFLSKFLFLKQNTYDKLDTPLLISYGKIMDLQVLLSSSPKLRL